MDHWAITTSSGRRVSLLCDEDSTPRAFAAPSVPYSRPVYSEGNISTESIRSNASSPTRYMSASPISPKSQMTFSRLTTSAYHSYSNSNTPKSSMIISPARSPVQTIPAKRPSLSTTNTSSSSAAPGSSSPDATKRSSRRYTCHCGKSFTTSGHLARHTRIHTGEKNYVCPESGCGARFSRQDNCMQHYRTHQNGGLSGSAGGRRNNIRRLSSSAHRRASLDGSNKSTSSSSGNNSDAESPAPRLADPVSWPADRRMSMEQISDSFQSGRDSLAALANVAVAVYA